MPVNKLNLFFVASFFLFLLFTLAFPLPTHASPDSGLVQCGRQFFGTENPNQAYCTICDLISLAQNLMNQAITYFAAPIAALMLGYGGFLMVIAGVRGGNPQQAKQGKTVLTNAIIGIVILFTSWLMVDTLLKSIGYSTENFGPWNVIQCESPAISVPSHYACNTEKQCVVVKGIGSDTCTENRNCGSTPQHLDCNGTTYLCAYIDGPGTNNCTEGAEPRCAKKTFSKCVRIGACEKVDGTGADQCTKGSDCVEGIGDFANNAESSRKLASDGVKFDNNAQCSGASAQTNLTELENAKPLTICHNGCRTDGNPCVTGAITADPNILKDLITLKEVRKQNFKVNSLATGDHGVNSDHYKGKAVDLKALPGTSYSDMEDFFGFMKANERNIKSFQCEFKSVKVDCASGGPDHIHVSYN